MSFTNPSPGSDRANIIRIVLLVLVLIGAVSAGVSAFHRNGVERDNRRVEIAVDFAELRTIAAAEGVPITDVLKRFKDAGVISVAVQEETIAGLQENRLLDAVPSGPDNQSTRIDTAASENGRNPALLRRITEVLQSKTRFSVTQPADNTDDRDTSILINQPWSVVRAVGVGLDPVTVNAVRGAGLGVVGRVGNWPGISPANILWTLGELKKQGASTLLFSGDEILGYKGYIADDPKNPTSGSTASALKNLGLFYGALEFGKQKGDPELAKAAPESTVRVHTIPGSEMVLTTEPEAIQRFSLAARERNIRLLFVRLFLDETDPLDFNVKFVGKIAKSLAHAKLETGIAHGYKPLGVSKGHRLLIGIGVGAAFVLLLDSITGFLAGGVGIWATVIALLGFLSIACAAAAPVALGPKLAALTAAVVFPSLALLMSDLLDSDLRTSAIGRFLFACFMTALGIVSVVGLLADRIFLIKADEFLGVKATLVVPIAIVALVYALDLRARPGRTFAQAVSAAGDRIARVAAEPVLIWQIVASVFVLALVVIVVARSGNESGIGVSATELKLRALLDRVLLARPRFKDVFGHAAMIMALLLVTRKESVQPIRILCQNLALPLFLLGVFGQESLLDTFCHLHTPIAVSLWRAVLGIVIGLILGFPAYAILDALLRRLSGGPERKIRVS